MGMHARAVVAEERLRHEGDRLSGRAGNVLDHVLVGHDLISHPGQRPVAEVDLALAARGDLVVVELAGDPQPFQRQHHLGAEVGQRVVRGRREVALLGPDRVAEARVARVPVPLLGVDLVVGLVVGELVRDRVEDEELALGSDVGRVGHAGLAQMLLGALGDPARVLRVRLTRDRVCDLADQREGRRGGKRVEDGARGIRHQQHVRLGDPLPTTNRGAVKAQSVVERRLVERR